MMSQAIISGFSALSREEKIQVASGFASDPAEFIRDMQQYWYHDAKIQDTFSEFTENVLSNYCLPYSLAPNFKINGRSYIVPMVTEESSVVAAAAAAAKFWWPHGGFSTRIGNKIKPGHIHFMWKGTGSGLYTFIEDIKPGLFAAVHDLEQSMKSRGGGVMQITLIDRTDKLKEYHQIEVLFNTADAMGANFINTCLEKMAEYMTAQSIRLGIGDCLEIILSILSNYTPQCVVECTVNCPVNDLIFPETGLSGQHFARKFETALAIAGVDISRAVTNNKGIFNGVDAVVLATGNDFRAVEASGHAWAAREDSYKGLSQVELRNDMFSLCTSLPLAVGVVGGLTNLHPLAKASLQLLGHPRAEELMAIAASAGLANHFSAIKALITHGIQHGHMKLHLVNLLNQLGASKQEKEQAMEYFKDKAVTHKQVREFIHKQHQ
jgi:hydroxymethylglutaryl-CoA reductase